MIRKERDLSDLLSLVFLSTNEAVHVNPLDKPSKGIETSQTFC